MKRWLSLGVAIIICEAAGALGALFTSTSVTGWYVTLVRPALAPPPWIFGPVWTTLYLLMGVAVWLVWHSTSVAREERRRALWLFALQFGLNAVWSPIFFGAHALGWALIEIALLWLAIVATIRAFARVSRAAAWLMAPYLAWVTFATYLTYALWLLNA